ncbi:MAG: diaminopimelate epimerase [Gemmatimonadetes bacterium]|nr:diaminopimelate epimerase [Gemmatimonadota bacterium]
MPIGPDGVHVRSVFEFSKYSGAGNDFVIARADDRSDPIGAELARRVCSRRTGVGVDGLILVYLRPDGIRVRFFNPDGSEFSTCGNGSRCAARFASDEGLGDPAGFVLETPAGEIDTRVDGDQVSLDYHIDVSLHGPIGVAGPEGPVDSWLVRIGVPHLVLPLDRMPEGPIEELCRPLRRLDVLGPDGANVNLVSLDDVSTGAVRTFERGVEAETLACGSGSMASVFVLRASGKAGPRVSLRVSGGDELGIEILDLSPPDGTVRDVRLSGPAVKLFEGTFPDTILAP